MKSRIKTLIKEVISSIDAKDAEKALKIFREAVSLIQKASRKRVIPENTASRKISRISKKVNALLKEKAL